MISEGSKAKSSYAALVGLYISSVNKNAFNVWVDVVLVTWVPAHFGVSGTWFCCFTSYRGELIRRSVSYLLLFGCSCFCKQKQTVQRNGSIILGIYPSSVCQVRGLENNNEKLIFPVIPFKPLALGSMICSEMCQNNSITCCSLMVVGRTVKAIEVGRNVTKTSWCQIGVLRCIFTVM